MKGIKWLRENEIDIGERGPTLELSQLVRVYYAQCTQEMHMMSAQHMKYTTGIEFRTRLEFKGIKNDKFSLRAIKVFTGQAGANPRYTNTTMHGTAVASSGTKYFIVSYKEFPDTGDTPSLSKLFCLSVGTSPYQYTPEAGANCSDLESGFGDIPGLKYSQAPDSAFDAKFK